MGDFNFDILNHETINQEFLHILSKNVYCPGFSNITRPSNKTGNSGTCIDNISIKLDKIAYKTFTLRIPLTDHFPLFMSLSKIRTIENLYTIKRVNFNKLREDDFTINWSELSQINNPNIALNNVFDKIKICLGKAEYTKKPNKTNIMNSRKDWVTKAIMISSKTKEKLYKILKKDPNNNKKEMNIRNLRTS